jgi:DNA-binding transcriptional LysR family regulator
MDLRWIDDFLALVDTRNFTRAAAQRFTTQSAFSRRIKSLEDWAGAPLFERRQAPVTLTSAGEAFLPRARELRQRIHEARETVRREAARELGTVVFAAPHTLSKHFFPKWLRTVEPASRATPIRLISQGLTPCLERLAARDCHFVLGHGPGLPPEFDSESYLTTVVGTDTIVPVSAPDRLGRPRFDTAGVAGRPTPILSYGPESSLARSVAALLAERGEARAFRSEFESGYADILKSMAVEGYGLAWLPVCDIADELAAGRLVRAGDERWTLSLDIVLLRTIDPLPPAAEAIWQASMSLADPQRRRA